MRTSPNPGRSVSARHAGILLAIIAAVIGAILLAQSARASVDFAHRSAGAIVPSLPTVDDPCAVTTSGDGSGITGTVTASSCVGDARTTYAETYAAGELTGVSGTVSVGTTQSGLAEYDLSFTVSADTSYSASAQLSGDPVQTLFILEKVGGGLIFNLRPLASNSQSGTLTPGSYRLEARTAVIAGNVEFSFNIGGIVPTATPTTPPTSTSTPTTTPAATATPAATDTPLPGAFTNTPTPTSSPTPSVTSTPTNTNTPAPPTSTSTPTPVATSTATATRASAPCADVTGDGRVNVLDLFIEARAIVSRSTDKKFDLNQDGNVDFGDLLAVVRQFGRRC